jgi:hypothetical protein
MVVPLDVMTAAGLPAAISVAKAVVLESSGGLDSVERTTRRRLQCQAPDNRYSRGKISRVKDCTLLMCHNCARVRSLRQLQGAHKIKCHPLSGRIGKS